MFDCKDSGHSQKARIDELYYNDSDNERMTIIVFFFNLLKPRRFQNKSSCTLENDKKVIRG